MDKLKTMLKRSFNKEKQSRMTIDGGPQETKTYVYRP